jgi:hypothetical protein
MTWPPACEDVSPGAEERPSLEGYQAGLQPPARAGSSLADFSTLKMEAIRSSETSVHTISTRRYIPEDGIRHSHRRENIKTTISPFKLSSSPFHPDFSDARVKTPFSNNLPCEGFPRCYSFKAQWLPYVPPDLTLQNFTFSLTVYVPYVSQNNQRLFL